MASAILYAWFRSYSPPQDAFSRTYIPLLDIPRDDIKLRPEFKIVLDRCNIHADNLITSTDLPSEDQLQVEQTQWVLVDHNKLEGDLSSIYSGHVVGCIDHHDEENAVPKQPSSEPRVVEKCGSCTSLILRELAKELANKSSSLEDKPPYTTDALKLGLASILIDTNNLQDKNKVTQIDLDVANSLDAALQRRSSDWSKDRYFEEISKAKKNLDGLPLNDVLRKDYKQWTEGSMSLGMSSVVRDFEFLAKLSQTENANSDQGSYWADAATKFMYERRLDLWVIMTAYSRKAKDGKEKFRRQLMVHWRDSSSAAIVKSFTEKCGSELNLESAEIEYLTPSPEENWKIWTQGNLAASRKQVGPMLRNVMKQNVKI